MPDGKVTNIKAEESALFGAATKQQAREGASDWEDLACAVAIFRVRELMTD